MIPHECINDMRSWGFLHFRKFFIFCIVKTLCKDATVLQPASQVLIERER